MSTTENLAINDEYKKLIYRYQARMLILISNLFGIDVM